MTESLQSINLPLESLISNRSVYTSDYVRSVSVNQTTGDFIVSKPLLSDGTLTIYPQSPNNPSFSLIGAIKNMTSFSGYGFLSMPVDARYDYTRNKIWVADMGNQRILKIDARNYLIDFAINDITLPYSVVPNINNGGVFVKSFINTTTGVVYYYSATGVLNSTFTFEETFHGTTLTPSPTISFIEQLPLPSTMTFDHSRSRLWFTSESYIYMIDLMNNQVIVFGYDYNDSRGIDVDMASGNAFVVMKTDAPIANSWYIVQIFRDNNRIISSAYLPDSIFIN